jgi:hypothetical protein
MQFANTEPCSMPVAMTTMLVEAGSQHAEIAAQIACSHRHRTPRAFLHGGGRAKPGSRAA